MVTHAWMYNEGAACLRETVGTGNLSNIGSEFPDVIMVCKSEVTEFISAVGQTIAKDPMVYTAVTASDNNMHIFAAFLPFLLLLGGVKKLLSLLASELAVMYFSII